MRCGGLERFTRLVSFTVVSGSVLRDDHTNSCSSQPPEPEYLRSMDLDHVEFRQLDSSCNMF